MLSFREFVLSGSVAPKPISFGTDDNMDNGQVNLQSGLVHTFFAFGDFFYCVGGVLVDHETLEVGFGASETHSLNLFDYSDSRRETRNSIIAFSHISYVLLQLLEHVPNVQKIIFSAANPALGSVYKRMVKNKPLNDALKDNGWVYDAELSDGEDIIYRKLNNV